MEFPVIHLNLATINRFETIKQFEEKLDNEYQLIAYKYGIEGYNSNLRIRGLITELWKKFERFPVFVLVDEYDSPFYRASATLQDLELTKNVSDALDAEFTEIKNSVELLGFALIMGVSRLPLSIFEIGAYFPDLTYDRDLADAFGIRESNLNDDDKIKFHMKKFAENTPAPSTKRWKEPATNVSKLSNNDESLKRIVDELKNWYDGYQFDEKSAACRVLNPVSTI